MGNDVQYPKLKIFDGRLVVFGTLPTERLAAAFRFLWGIGLGVMEFTAAKLCFLNKSLIFKDLFRTTNFFNHVVTLRKCNEGRPKTEFN